MFLTWNVCLNCLFVLRINVLRDASKVNTHFSTVAIEKIFMYIWKEVSEKRVPKTSPFFRCTSVQYNEKMYDRMKTQSMPLNSTAKDRILPLFCCTMVHYHRNMKFSGLLELSFLVLEVRFLAYGIPATNSATMNPEFLDQIFCFF